MPRGLIDHDSFLKLQPAAQDNLLRQSLLLWLTALDLAGRDPDAWEATAFSAATDLLAMAAPLRAYREIERMLLPHSARPPRERAYGLLPTTGILRVEIAADTRPPPPPTPSPPRETPDRHGLRRRLLQLSAIQLPPDRTEPRRSVVIRNRRGISALAEAEDAGDD